MTRSITAELSREEKRRQLTIFALAVGLVVSAIPVNNQRALFSPLGDIPVLGQLSPVAYAATFGSGVGGPLGGGYPGGRSGAGSAPPVAYAARVPGVPVGGDRGQPLAGPPGNLPGAFLPGDNGGAVPGGGPLGGPIGGPGGAPGGGGGTGGGGSSGGGSLPPGSPGTGSGGGLPTPDATGAVPEPATWLTMILGFGVIGTIMRRARRRDVLTSRALSEG